jgi:hypothetical protein
MARKAKEKTSEPKKEKMMFAVFINLSDWTSAICVANDNYPTVELDGTLSFYAGDCDDLAPTAVFKDWSFYKEVQYEDMGKIDEWLENTKVLEA